MNIPELEQTACAAIVQLALERQQSRGRGNYKRSRAAAAALRRIVKSAAHNLISTTPPPGLFDKHTV